MQNQSQPKNVKCIYNLALIESQLFSNCAPAPSLFNSTGQSQKTSYYIKVQSKGFCFIFADVSNLSNSIYQYKYPTTCVPKHIVIATSLATFLCIWKCLLSMTVFSSLKMYLHCIPSPTAIIQPFPTTSFLTQGVLLSK